MNPEPWATSASPKASAAAAIDATGYSPGVEKSAFWKASTESRPTTSPIARPIPSSPTHSSSMSAIP